MPMGCETFHLAIGTFPPNGYNYMEWLMKKVPEIASLRQSFRGWEADKGNIQDMAQQVAGLIASPESYESFMQAFLGDQRVDSPFMMECFGNPHSDGLPDDALLRLNAVDISTLEKGYVIANGTKINVDEEGIKVLETLGSRDKTGLDLLTVGCDAEQQVKIKALVMQLGMLDVIEILNV